MAHGEKNVVLGVQAKPARTAAFARQVEVCCHLESLDVNDGDVVLVLKIDIKMSFFVACRLFGRAAQVDGADDGAVLGIEQRGVGLTVAEDIDALRGGFKQNAVRPARDCDFLDQFQGLCVKHADGAAAAEAVVGFGVNGDAVAARV